MDGNRNDTPQQKTVTLTPGSDFVFNFRNDQNSWARHGNDIILAFDPAAPIPIPPLLTELEGSADQFDWDILLGDFLDEDLNPDLFRNPDLTGRPGRDRFVLGDWRQPYYLDNFLLGLQQQAIVADFQPELDIIQLHGRREDYTLIPFALFGPNPQTGETEVVNGKALAWKSADPFSGQPDFDIIAFFPDVPPGPGLPAEGLPLADFDLNGDYFQFVGNTPPPGPARKTVKQLGTKGVDAAFGVSADPYGNIYVLGGTTGALGGTSQGSWDIWIAKYDNSGNQIWTKQFGTSETEVAWDIQTFLTDTGDVNFYITGSTTGDLALELGGTGANEGYQDIITARFDSDGNVIWAQQNPQPLPGPEIDNALQIDVDKKGNLYQSGVTVETLPEGSLISVQDFAWVAKYKPSGALEWFNGDSLESTDQAGFDESYGVAVSADGSTFATGFTQNNLGGPRIGVYDVWLSRFDTAGNQLWTTKFGTINYDFAWGVDTDSQNNAYVAGWTRGDLGAKNAGDNDVFLAKYDSQGNQKWIKQFGTSGDDGLFLGDVVVDSSDNIYITGFTDRKLEGDNAGSYDAWVAKYNSQGQRLWIEQFGSSGLDMPTDLSVNEMGQVFVAGFTEGSLGALNEGATDAWIAKLDAKTGTLKNFNPTNPPKPSTISINDVIVNEGLGKAIFTVSLSDASRTTVKVDYATAPGTTLEGKDYEAARGTLTFKPGEKQKTIEVKINDGNSPELNETFFVNLSNAVNATIADNQGQGTIIDNDAITPSIDIEKLTNGIDADTAETAVMIQAGQAVKWTYKVTNTGNVAFAYKDIVVTDDKGIIPVFDATTDKLSDRILSPGESWIYQASAQAENLKTVIDFEKDGNGKSLKAGAVINNEYKKLGLTVSTPRNRFGAMIFDSSKPTGGDTDLGTPNQTFGGPGIGSGGKRGMPGANSQSLKNILIISEDGNSWNPDDEAHGGTVRFKWDDLVRVNHVGILDADSDEPGGAITTYNAKGKLIESHTIANLSNNSYQKIAINDEFVRHLDVNLVSSGAVTEISFDRFYKNTGTVRVKGYHGVRDSDVSYYRNPTDQFQLNNNLVYDLKEVLRNGPPVSSV